MTVLLVLQATIAVVEDPQHAHLVMCVTTTPQMNLAIHYSLVRSVILPQHKMLHMSILRQAPLKQPMSVTMVTKWMFHIQEFTLRLLVNLLMQTMVDFVLKVITVQWEWGLSQEIMRCNVQPEPLPVAEPNL